MKFYAGIGSRQTPREMLNLMTRLARYLATKGYVLRSGGAPGADTAFEMGAGAAAEIIIPWPGFERRYNAIVFSNSQALEDAMAIAEKFHPVWSTLTNGAKLLMARNVAQVLGPSLDSPVDFVLCWTPHWNCDASGRVVNASGGTGMAVRLAAANGIPVRNLAVPAHLEKVLAALEEKPAVVAEVKAEPVAAEPAKPKKEKKERKKKTKPEQANLLP